MPAVRGEVGARPTARAGRAAARKSAAETGQALANHYSPPEGGAQPHGEIQLRRSHTVVPKTAQETAFDAGLAHENASRTRLAPPVPAPRPRSHTGFDPRSFGEQAAANPTRNPVISVGHLGLGYVSDALHTASLQGRMLAAQIATRGVGPASYKDPSLDAISATHVKNGHVVLPNDPALRDSAMGLIQPPATGNMLQRVGYDALALPAGLVDYGGEAIDKGPLAAGKDFGKGQYDYYHTLVTHPAATVRQDPVMAALAVMPFLHVPGSIIGRAADVASTARVLRGGEVSAADMYRYLPKHAASHALDTGELPPISTLKKAGLLGRAAIK